MEKTWDVEVFKQRVRIPPGLRLVMADVDCGSATPGMVKSVLAWRAANPDESGMLWTALHAKNEGVAAELTRLAESGSTDYTGLRKVLNEVRTYIREMSRLSGVPIEPPPQTDLLDACSAVPGVIGGVVPGAGGYDAIVLLVEDAPEVLSRLDELLQGWKVEAVDDPEDGMRIGRVSRLPVREEMEGVRVEGAEGYGAWIGAS